MGATLRGRAGHGVPHARRASSASTTGWAGSPPGCYADMVAFDDRIAVTQTWIRGGMLAHEAVRA